MRAIAITLGMVLVCGSTAVAAKEASVSTTVRAAPAKLPAPHATPAGKSINEPGVKGPQNPPPHPPHNTKPGVKF